MIVERAVFYAVFTACFLSAVLLTLGLGANGLLAGRVPDLTPVVIFFFAFHRPHLFSLLLTFVLGIFADLLYHHGVGSGTGALLVVACAAQLCLLIRSGVPWLVETGAFLLVSIGFTSLLWLLSNTALASAPPMADVLYQSLGTTFIYVLLRKPLLWLVALRKNPAVHG